MGSEGRVLTNVRYPLSERSVIAEGYVATSSIVGQGIVTKKLPADKSMVRLTTSG